MINPRRYQPLASPIDEASDVERGEIRTQNEVEPRLELGTSDREGGVVGGVSGGRYRSNRMNR